MATTKNFRLNSIECFKRMPRPERNPKSGHRSSGHIARNGRNAIRKVGTGLPIAPSTYHAHALVVRHPERASNRAKRDAVLLPEVMTFRLMMSAKKKWRKLDGAFRLPEIIEGVEFKDGVKQKKHAAWLQRHQLSGIIRVGVHSKSMW